MHAEARARDVRRLGDALGAELLGVDLSRTIDDATAETLREALWENPVLVVRNQTLTPEHLMRAGRVFGELVPHNILKYRHPDYPEISYITNVGPDGKVDEYGATVRASDWHSDGCFKPIPDCVGLLYSVAAPSRGGPTMFANMYLAFETLPAPLKARIAGLRAFHGIALGRPDTAPPPLTAEQRATGLYDGRAHPVVRTHPETCRKALFVNPTHTGHIVGLPADESRGLLGELYAHALKSEHQYSHDWRVGDLVLWDQRAVVHKAGGGAPPGEKRVMMRTMATYGGPPV